MKGIIFMKTIIITGANSGLGFECAKNILLGNSDYFVIMACRNTEKAEKAKEELIEKTKNKNVSVMELDLSSFDSVRKFVNDFKTINCLPLYGIVCNAGVGSAEGITKDGFEIIFGTNHLGHFLLTNLLLPLVADNGRIIVVSSDMHNPPQAGFTYPGVEALAYPDSEVNNRYSQSKLCNLYFTYELVKKLDQIGSNITVNAFNPDLIINTNFHENHSYRFTEDFLKSVSDRMGNLSESGKALAEMVTKSYYGENTGKYNDRGEEKPSSELSYNAENAEKLWKSSINYTNLKQEETIVMI
jgi:NAD(P)-dependent dehydrogenase (short-subunit alcohol dehydrogenase family)